MKSNKSDKGSIEFNIDMNVMLFVFLERDDIGAKVDLNLSNSGGDKYRVTATNGRNKQLRFDVKSGDRINTGERAAQA